MPYSLSKPGKLPKAVRKHVKGKARRRQWTHIWNQEFNKHGDESRAFAAANSVTMDKGGNRFAKGHSVAKKELSPTLDEQLMSGMGLDLSSIFLVSGSGTESSVAGYSAKETLKHIDEGAADTHHPGKQNKKSQRSLTKNSKKVIETVGKLGVKEAMSQSGGSHHIDIDSHNEGETSGERMAEGMTEEGKLKLAKIHAKMAKKIAKHLIGAKEQAQTQTGSKAYVEMPFPGSHKETRSKLSTALSSSDTGDSYHDILATHGDKVIYSKSSYEMGGKRKLSHWERPYKVAGEGVELGEAKELIPGMLEKSSKELGLASDFDLESNGAELSIKAVSMDMLVDEAIALWATSDGLTVGQCAKLTAAARKKLPDSKFAYVDKQGVGHFPINDAAHVRNALARLDQSPYGDKARAKVQAAAKKMGVGEPAKASKEAPATGVKSAGSTVDAISRMAQAVADSGRPIMFFKDKAGQQRFFLVGTNNYQDREDELFTAAAHKEFIQWCDTQGSYPELWLWHAKGSRFGQVDWLDFVKGGEGEAAEAKAVGGSGGMVCASGTIDNTKAARQLVSRIKEYDGAVSHGFVGVRNKEGHWTKYRSWEFSWLPREAASNIGTAFNLLEGAKEMGFDPIKRAALTQLVGSEATVKEWEQQTDKMNEGLAALGIRSKELTDLMAETKAKAKVKADASDDEPDNEPDDDEDDKKPAAGGSKEVTAGFKAIQETLTAQTKALTQLSESVALSLETSKKALKRANKALETSSTSLDDAVAAAIAPRGTSLASVKSGAKEKVNDGGTLDADEVERLGQPSSGNAEKFQRTVSANLAGVMAGGKGLGGEIDPVALEMASAKSSNGQHDN